MFRLRWEMFRSGLRSIHGILDLGATGIAWMIYAFFGLLFGTGMGIGTYALVSDAQWRYLPILFWVLCFLWQMIPVMLASYQEQFDLGILLRFPVHFGSYYFLYLVFGLLDVSTVLGAVCCLGMWIGVAVARPALLPWITLALAVFAAFNILLVRAIFAWIERWLRQRKTREILGAVFMILVLSAQLMNPAIYQKRHSGRSHSQQQAQQFEAAKERYKPYLKQANAVQKWLPPGLAAQALRQSVEQNPAAGFVSLGVLGLYGVLVGGILAARLKSEYRGESLSVAPGRAKSATGSRTATGAGVSGKETQDRGAARMLGGSGPIAAVIEKDVRALMRTLPLLYAIGAPLLLVLVFSTVFLKNGATQAPVFPLALPICMVYAQLGFTQVFFNNLGTEGAGILFPFAHAHSNGSLGEEPVTLPAVRRGRHGGRCAGCVAAGNPGQCGHSGNSSVAGVLSTVQFGRGQHLFAQDALPRKSRPDCAATWLAGQRVSQPACPIGSACHRRVSLCALLVS
jgi:ABC-2 type transport system permease protein